MKRLLDDEALRERGIRHSKSQRNRLIKGGKFPKPIYIGCRPHWPDDEIDQLIEDRIAERDGKAA